MTRGELATEHVNGIDLAYRRWEAPAHAQHPPIVLLHGVLQTGEGMRHLADLLASGSEVIVPDLRGRGASEQPAGGYDPSTMADDVAALLDRLGVGPVVVIGRMHGGLVAYHLASRRPDLVAGVVLGDADPEVGAERAHRILARVRALPDHFASLEEAERFYEVELKLPPDRARNDLPIDLELAADGTYRWRHNLDIVHRIEEAAMPRSDWEVIAGVRCPALLLYGQRGSIPPETVARLLAEMPHARAQAVIGSGHDVFLGPGAEQTLAAIQLFLRGLAA
ncbi:MAG: alpha/beta hydrolase [Thermomicrobiales bacterium]|nr:alpha/beta hydrolase [Thermomicrobiales bacterium]